MANIHESKEKLKRSGEASWTRQCRTAGYRESISGKRAELGRTQDCSPPQFDSWVGPTGKCQVGSEREKTRLKDLKSGLRNVDFLQKAKGGRVRRQTD